MSCATFRTWWALASETTLDVKRRIVQVKQFPATLWALLMFIFVWAAAEFFFISVLIQYLSKDVGISDVNAGLLVGLFGALAVLYSLVAGMLVDNLSVFGAVAVAACLATAARLLMAFSLNSVVVLVCLLVAIPIAEALAGPAMCTGLKRFSPNAEMRAVACGLNYAVTNLGAIPALIFSDVIRLSIESGNGAIGANATVVGTTVGLRDSGRRAVVFVSGLVNAVCLVLACVCYAVFVCGFDRRQKRFELQQEAVYNDANNVPLNSSWSQEEADENGPEAKKRDFVDGVDEACRCSFLKRAFPVDSVKVLCSSRNFWCYLVFVVVLTNVRSLFYHLNITFPKYSSRAYNSGFPYGVVTSLNPAIIIPLSIVLSAAMARADAVKCIIAGSFVCAVSPVLMALANRPVFSVLFVVLFSVGEAVWSPLTTTYMLNMSPDNMVGMFSTLATIPNCGSKIPTGLLSGFLLDRLCSGKPGTTCNGRVLWLIVSALALTSPLLLLVQQAFHSSACCRRRCCCSNDDDDGGDNDTDAERVLSVTGDFGDMDYILTDSSGDNSNDDGSWN